MKSVAFVPPNQGRATFAGMQQPVPATYCAMSQSSPGGIPGLIGTQQPFVMPAVPQNSRNIPQCCSKDLCLRQNPVSEPQFDTECVSGGTSIEDLAEKYPDKIIKIPVDIFEGITDEQANKMVEGLQVQGDKQKAAEQIKALYKTFTDSDCTMVEVQLSNRPDTASLAHL